MSSRRVPIFSLKDKFIPKQFHITTWPRDAVPFLSSLDWGQMLEPSCELDDVVCCDNPPLCCDSSCSNWHEQVECAPHSHGLNKRCGNMQFQFPPCHSLALYKVEVGSERQYGLVVASKIDAGSLIVEFTGKVKLEHEVDVQSNCYWMQLDGDAYIDASECGSLARFVNHSCEPNCAFQCWMVPRPGPELMFSPRVGLFALRDLMPEEVATVDFRLMSEAPGSIVCLCGRDSCTGALDRDRWRCKALPPEWTSTVAEYDVVDICINEPKSVAEETESSFSIGLNRSSVKSDFHPKLQSFMRDSSALNIFHKYGWYFTKISKDSKDVTSQFSNVMTRLAKDDFNLSHNIKDLPNGAWQIQIIVFGIVFTGTGPSQVKARLDAVLQCLECMHAGATVNPGHLDVVIPAHVAHNNVNDGDAAIQLSVEDFLVTAHRKLKNFHQKISKFGAEHVQIQRRAIYEETAILCGTIHVYLSSPVTVLKYLGAQGARIHKGLPMSGPPSKCLANRKKLIEIGTRHRLAHFSKKYVTFSTTFGPCLVRVSPSQMFRKLEDVLRMHGVTLHNVVDAVKWKEETKTDLTIASIMRHYASKQTERGTRRVTRINRIWASRLEQVLYPLQSASEVQGLIELMEKEVSLTLSKSYLERVRKILAENPSIELDVYVTIGNREEALSSMICAEQLKLTDIEYMRDKDTARRLIRDPGQMDSVGFRRDDVPDLEWRTLRTIYERWSAFVTDTNLSGAHRIILGGVDEWLCVGPDATVNDAFYNGLCGTSFAHDLLKMPIHDKGLSAVAMTQAGRCFARGEYWEIMFSEILTNDEIKNIISAYKIFMASRPMQPVQVVHADDISFGAVFHFRSLNTVLDFPNGYSSTLMSTQPTRFENDGSPEFNRAVDLLNTGATVPEIINKCPAVGVLFEKCYRSVCSMLPEDMDLNLQPVFPRFTGGHGIYSFGSTLHAAPGTMNVPMTIKYPRLVCLTVTSIGWKLYSGQSQIFLNQLHEAMWGPASFMCLLHIVDGALIKGIHVSDHYEHVLLPSHKFWKTVKLPAQWSKGQFLKIMVECVIRVMNPSLASEFTDGVKHVPGYFFNSKKRNADRTVRLERYGFFYERSDVFDAFISLWEYLNMPRGRREKRLSTKLSSPECTVDFASWPAAEIFEQLLCAYRVAARAVSLEDEVPGWESAHQRGHGYAELCVKYRGKLNRTRSKLCYEQCKEQVVA